MSASQAMLDSDRERAAKATAAVPAERFYVLGYEVGGVRDYLSRCGHRHMPHLGSAAAFSTPSSALCFALAHKPDHERGWRIYRVDVVRRAVGEQRRIIATADECPPGECVDFVLRIGEGDRIRYLDDDDGWTGDLRTAARLDDAINAVQTHIRFPGSRIQMLAVTPATEGTTEYVVTELE